MLNQLNFESNDVEITKKTLNNAPFVFDEKTMVRVDVSGWVRYAQFIGTERVTKKNGTKGYKEFNHNDSNMDFQNKSHQDWGFLDWKSHHIGLLAEIGYALVTDEQPDMVLKSFGDGNQDFKGGVDVKSTWSHNKQANCIIENCYKAPLNQISKYYVKANIDWETKEVILVGWCSGDYLVREGVQHNFGKANPAIGDDGERFVVHFSELKSIYTLPPFVAAMKRKMDKMTQYQTNMMRELIKFNI